MANKPPVLSPKPDIVKRFSFTSKSPEQQQQTHSSPERNINQVNGSGGSGPSNEGRESAKTSTSKGLNEEEIDLVRKFSSEIQFKSLDDLKSNKILGDVDSSEMSSLLSTASESSSMAEPITTSSSSAISSNTVVSSHMPKASSNSDKLPASPTKKEAGRKSSSSSNGRGSSFANPPHLFQAQHQAVVDESTLFQSLDPLEGKQFEEEFEKLTQTDSLELIEKEEDAKVDKQKKPEKVPRSPPKKQDSSEGSSGSGSTIPFADEDTIDALTSETKDESDDKFTTAKEEADVVEALNKHTIEKPSRLPITNAYAPAAMETAKLAAQEVFSPDSNDSGGGAGEAPITNSNSSGKEQDKLDSSSEVDEFQDEIHFDPTISSGHLGSRGGDFRNTPITFGASNTPQPIYQNTVETTTATPSSSTSVTTEVVDEMTPTEAEKLLSTELKQQRRQELNQNQVLSDEEAKEVVALLTPDKDLPPLPLETSSKDPDTDGGQVTSSDIGSSIESWTTNSARQSSMGMTSDTAIDKLDSLVYSASTATVSTISETKETSASAPSTTWRRCRSFFGLRYRTCLLYTSPSPRDRQKSRMPSSA